MSFLYPQWDPNSEIEQWTLEALRTMVSVDATIQCINRYTCGRNDVLDIVKETLDYHAVPWNFEMTHEGYQMAVTLLETLRSQPASDRAASPDDSIVVVDDDDDVDMPPSPPLVRHLRVVEGDTERALYNAKRYKELAQTARCGAEMFEYSRLAEESMKDALAVAASV